MKKVLISMMLAVMMMLAAGSANAAGPTSIEIFPSPQTLKVGQTSTIYAKQTGAIGGTYFYSEDNGIATVTSGELASQYSYTTVAEITAVSPGTVNIVAKNVNGIYTKCKVTVTAPRCTGISIPENREMNVGTIWAIPPSITPASAQPTLSWKSSNTNVVTVTQAGVVTAKGVGNATVTVTTDNDYSASCLISVKDPNPAPTAISMEKEINLDVNQTYTLKPSVEPYNAKTTLSWKSSDNTVAEITQSGVVTAKSPGETIITVTTDNGKSASCRVIVEGATPMSEYELTLYVNQGGKVICNNMLTRGFKKLLFYEDDDIVMTVLPEQGYQIAGIWVNGEEVTDKVNDDMLTISGINKNSYVVVSFELEGSSSSDSTKQGDVNKDGEVDISDVVKVINIIAGNNGD